MTEKLTKDQHNVIEDINTNLKGAILDIAASLPRARSASLATTKIEEAIHWLNNLGEKGE